VSDNIRIGLGIDLHRLAPGNRCVLAGLELESPVGPDAHSDGDAVLHALCDAVLGAAGLDDLGTLFPDQAEENRDRPSSEFCERALALIRDKGLRVQSLDVVVETEKPAIKPHRAAMRARISELFDVDPDAVNIKGKSGEKTGAIGRSEALRVTAVALLNSR